jgi:hypothetical protein
MITAIIKLNKYLEIAVNLCKELICNEFSALISLLLLLTKLDMKYEVDMNTAPIKIKSAILQVRGD